VYKIELVTAARKRPIQAGLYINLDTAISARQQGERLARPTPKATTYLLTVSNVGSTLDITIMILLYHYSI